MQANECVLFEREYRGNVWRFEISNYQGKTRANFRKWFWSGDDKLRATRDGIHLSLDELRELRDAIDEALLH